MYTSFKKNKKTQATPLWMCTIALFCVFTVISQKYAVFFPLLVIVQLILYAGGTYLFKVKISNKQTNK